MLTVWCVYWGDKYPKYYVQRLQREVAKHLPVPHTFRCLSDQQIDGVVSVRQISDKPGWWQKLDLFYFHGPNLYLDLDVVITGDLSPFIGTDAEIRTCKNWAQSGHGGCQSSIMYWEDARYIYDSAGEFEMNWPPVNRPGVCWGDQEAITELRDQGRLEVDYFDPDLIASYKYHVKGKPLRDNCRCVIFHGEPKPESLAGSLPWLKW